MSVNEAKEHFSLEHFWSLIQSHATKMGYELNETHKAGLTAAYPLGLASEPYIGGILKIAERFDHSDFNGSITFYGLDDSKNSINGMAQGIALDLKSLFE